MCYLFLPARERYIGTTTDIVADSDNVVNRTYTKQDF